MSTLNGIFDPFYEYVQDQLNLRKEIIGNINILATKNVRKSGKSKKTKKINILGPKLDGQRHEKFHEYVTQRQCTIRMASGVDIRADIKYNILEELERTAGFTGAELAKRWVLQSGTRQAF